MTKIEQYLAGLPEEKKALFIPVFGGVEKFYTVVYLIARNEHVTDQEKPDRYEDRLRVIRQTAAGWRRWSPRLVWMGRRSWPTSPAITSRTMLATRNPCSTSRTMSS